MKSWSLSFWDISISFAPQRYLETQKDIYTMSDNSQGKTYTVGVSFADSVLDRLSAALGARNDSQLARVLGEKRSTVGNWRSRNLPAGTIIKIAQQHGLSLDHLFYGKPEKAALSPSAGFDDMAAASPARPAEAVAIPGAVFAAAAQAMSALAAGRFADDMEMPVRGYAKCSPFGHLEKESDYREAPAPQGIRDVDPDVFYVVARGISMLPEGIREGDYCLVSPNTPIAPGMRIWLKDLQGRACIKRLLADNGESYSLRGWLEPENGRQASYNDEWSRDNVVECGAVLAVWRGRPGQDRPPAMIPDPCLPAPAVPPALARRLGLPEGASMADAMNAIEARAARTISSDVFSAFVEEKTQSLRGEIISLRQSLADAGALALAQLDDDANLSAARPLPVAALDIPAEGDVRSLPKEAAHSIWFSRSWFAEHDLDPARCAAVTMAGTAMEPLLAKGSTILVDLVRKHWQPGRILLLKTAGGLILRRAARDVRGRPRLVAENPAMAPVSLPDGAEILGHIVWTARSLNDPC